MLSGEAAQRGRYAGFGDGSFDDPPTYQLDSDASPRFSFPLHEQYEDDMLDEVRGEPKRSLKDSHGSQAWPGNAAQNQQAGQTPSPAPLRGSSDLSSYGAYSAAPYRGNSMLDMDSADGGMMLGADAEHLGSSWPHSDYGPPSSRSTDEIKPYMEENPSMIQSEVTESTVTSNQVSPTSVGSNETSTTDALSQSAQSTTTSPMDTTSPRIHAYTTSKTQRASSKAKTASHGTPNSENRAGATASKKRQRNAESVIDMTEKDDLFQVSAPPSKRQVSSKKTSQATGSSGKRALPRTPKQSEDHVGQEPKNKKIPISNADSSYDSVQHSPNDPSAITQTGTTTVRIRATITQANQKQPTTPVVTTPNSAAAFKMPSSLPSSYFKAVTSPQASNAGATESVKVDPSGASPGAAHSSSVAMSPGSNAHVSNIYSLMGTSPPDINQGTTQSVHSPPSFNVRPSSQQPSFAGQQPMSMGSNYQYGQASPIFTLNRSAPNVPSGGSPQAPPRSGLAQSHSGVPATTDPNSAPQQSNVAPQSNRPALDLEKLIHVMGRLSSHCQGQLSAFVVHPSSTEEQWSNLENLLALKRYVAEMNDYMTASVQEVQHQSAAASLPNSMAQQMPNQMPNQMPSQMPNQMPNHYYLPSSLPTAPHQHNNHQGHYMGRPPLPLPSQPMMDNSMQHHPHGMHMPHNGQGYYPAPRYGHNSGYTHNAGGYNPGQGSGAPNPSLPKMGMSMVPGYHHFPQNPLPSTPSSPWNSQLPMGLNAGGNK